MTHCCSSYLHIKKIIFYAVFWKTTRHLAKLKLFFLNATYLLQSTYKVLSRFQIKHSLVGYVNTFFTLPIIHKRDIFACQRWTRFYTLCLCIPRLSICLSVFFLSSILQMQRLEFLLRVLPRIIIFWLE